LRFGLIVALTLSQAQIGMTLHAAITVLAEAITKKALMAAGPHSWKVRRCCSPPPALKLLIAKSDEKLKGGGEGLGVSPPEGKSAHRRGQGSGRKRP
jgi:hypothetical protein